MVCYTNIVEDVWIWCIITKIYADDKILEALFMDNKTPTLKWRDHGGENDMEKNACFYLTISYLLFGSEAHYMEIKIALSHIFELLGRLPKDHKMWSIDTLVLQILDLQDLLQSEDDDMVDEPTSVAVTTQELEESSNNSIDEASRLLKCMAKRVMFPDHWGGDIEFNLLASLFNVRFSCVSASSQKINAKTKRVNKKYRNLRKWSVICNHSLEPLTEFSTTPVNEMESLTHFVLAQMSQRHFGTLRPQSTYWEKRLTTTKGKSTSLSSDPPKKYIQDFFSVEMKDAKAEKDLVNPILSKVKSVPQEQAKAIDPTVEVQKQPIEVSPIVVTSEEQQQIQQYLEDRSDKFYHNNYKEKIISSPRM
jgi:hypothetical protein